MTDSTRLATYDGSITPAAKTSVEWECSDGDCFPTRERAIEHLEFHAWPTEMRLRRITIHYGPWEMVDLEDSDA